MAKRVDWYRWFPKDIQTSRNYQRMSAAQRGAYRDMLDECWINMEKGCGIQVEPEWLAQAWGNLDAFDGGEIGSVGWRTDGIKQVEPLIEQIVNVHDPAEWMKVMPAVLRMFRVDGGKLVNNKMLEEVDNALEAITNSKIRRTGKAGNEPDSSQTPVKLQSNSSFIPTLPTLPTSTDLTNMTPASVGDVLDETQGITDEILSGKKKGVPGFYQRGLYPGTSPKAIFSHIAKAWSRIRGAAAVCRYPSKYPESWEMLCDQKSGDLLVPAFELWSVKNGYNTEWPLPEFIKVAQEYMAQVIPMKETKPALTEDVIARSNAVANQRHEELWAPKEEKSEPDASAFLETQ